MLSPKIAFLAALLSLFGAPAGARAAGAVSSASSYAKYNYRANGAIQGHCTVQASIGNPLPASCKGISLVLKSEAGEELEHIRTDAQGNFKFKAENGLKYSLSCATEDCEIVSPKGSVRGGDLLDIRVDTSP